MENEAVNLDLTKHKEMLSTADINFLGNLRQNSEAINKELKQLESDRTKIVEKILENKKENEPKYLRQSVSDAELALESIDSVNKNLEEVQNCYRNVEKSIIIIYEKYKIGAGSDTTEERDLIEKINTARTVERNNKVDNEKNYVIIKGFLEKEEQEYFKADSSVNYGSVSLDNLEDNMVLRIKERRVELPYTKKEIENYMKTYPDEYKTVQDVISKEFMIHISVYNKHPVLSRFKETYYLCRTKEMMTIFESFSYAKGIMFKSNINPYIIAAVKSKRQLEDYIDCLEKNNLDAFKHFKIIYEINPLSNTKLKMA